MVPLEVISYSQLKTTATGAHPSPAGLLRRCYTSIQHRHRMVCSRFHTHLHGSCSTPLEYLPGQISKAHRGRCSNPHRQGYINQRRYHRAERNGKPHPHCREHMAQRYAPATQLRAPRHLDHDTVGDSTTTLRWNDTIDGLAYRADSMSYYLALTLKFVCKGKILHTRVTPLPTLRHDLR